MKKFKLGPVKRKDWKPGFDSTEILFIGEEAALVKAIRTKGNVGFFGESLESLHRDYIPNNEPRRFEEVHVYQVSSSGDSMLSIHGIEEGKKYWDFLKSIGPGKKVKVTYEEVLE